jgi:hypothetical protein
MRQVLFLKDVGTAMHESPWDHRLSYPIPSDWSGPLCMHRWPLDPEHPDHTGWFIKSGDPSEPEPAEYYHGPVYSLWNDDLRQ